MCNSILRMLTSAGNTKEQNEGILIMEFTGVDNTKLGSGKILYLDTLLGVDLV